MAMIEVSCKTGYNIRELRQLIYKTSYEIKEKGRYLGSEMKISFATALLSKGHCHGTFAVCRKRIPYKIIIYINYKIKDTMSHEFRQKLFRTIQTNILETFRIYRVQT